MKILHVTSNYSNSTDACKNFKRKARRRLKLLSEEKGIRDSKNIVDSLGLFVDAVYENGREKQLQPFDSTASRGEHRRNSDIVNTIDTKTHSMSTFPGSIAKIQAQSILGATVKASDTTSLQATIFDNQQGFPKIYSPQSCSGLCKRSEKSFSSSSQVPYISNNAEPTDSSRKRLGETSGIVNEIKAVQQTRRLLANARERTRVHTISAAFEALRKQVPCYSYGQKLSKLAILRIACNYILSLAQLADLDYSPDHSNISFKECVEQCTRTLQAEGRSKKRKE
ncbi:transcription factor atoh8-like [Trichomycterus rosablanca]|uniref:transcription factor atoh8-like n=1 Tax=Trichomycterus rosablanca TaxID=2290929 RepID=UPI002F35BA88